MPEEEEIGKKTVKYSGYFDFGRLYQLLYDLFTNLDYKIHEEKYLKDEVDGVINIHWGCYKFIDNYTKYDFSMEIMYVAFGEGQVQKGGRRVEMEKGDMEINFKATLVTDRKGEWEENIILRNLKGFYERFIYGDTLETYSDELEQEIYEIVAETKDFFNI